MTCLDADDQPGGKGDEEAGEDHGHQGNEQAAVADGMRRLQELGGGEAVPLEGREENIVFEVPKELRIDAREVE